MIAQIGQAALRAQGRKQPEVAVAMDATGMETTTASAHYVSRSGKERRRLAQDGVRAAGFSARPFDRS